MPYSIIQLAEDAPTQLEQLGTKTKFWYRNKDELSMLFKEGRPNTGENWAEVACCEICRLLDLPHAEYTLARWKDRKGVVTPSFVPQGGRLVLGNELLAKIIDNYEEGKRYQVRQHTVRIVLAVTSNQVIGLPLGWSAPDEIKDAASVFVGYLLLDSLVSNQDRHHENWGMVVCPGQGIYLAPTFDHASSLGRNESDQVRTQRLFTRDRGRNIEAYVERSRSALFVNATSSKPLTTLAAFKEAAKFKPKAAEYWLKKLDKLDRQEYVTTLANVPDSEISVPARDFACRMLEINTNRILQTDI